MTERKMVDSGVEWIGEVPEGWEARYVKDVADVHLGKMLTPNEANGTSEVHYFRAANVTGTTATLKTMHATSYDVRKNMVSSGDILICEGGSIGYPRQLFEMDIPQPYAIIQNSVHRLRFNREQRYGYWLARGAYDSGAYLEAINSVSIAHLTKEKLEKFLVPHPPIAEQKSIAAYLDHHVGLIDRERGLVKRKIELLKDKRKALIFEAVTGRVDVGFGAIATDGNGGIRKSVASGVEWIGEVPEGWSVSRLSKEFTSYKRGATPKYVEDSKFLMVNQACISSYSILMKKAKEVSAMSGTRGLFLKSDILLASTGGGIMGKCAIAENNGYCDSHVTILKSKSLHLSNLVFYWLSASFDWLQQFGKGSTNQIELQIAPLMATPFPIPPIAEQKSIAAYLDHYIGLIDRELNLIKRKDGLLCDKRKALIFEAVTGKIDVTTAV